LAAPLPVAPARIVFIQTNTIIQAEFIILRALMVMIMLAGIYRVLVHIIVLILSIPIITLLAEQAYMFTFPDQY
jgi:hypothetical protein